ncbi:MAG TPA: hypothetical protein PLQ56_23170 [Aggregatilineales bacterium]|nr:hypothetical protein [Anaerolineae bacterium]HUN09525.1 hypothetical protein [Aggregatilineales bacterium]
MTLPTYTDSERNAMRAFLQRCEVRLSTLHRIATAFIGGAGLLLLVPVFLKDAFDSILAVLLTSLPNHFPGLDGVGVALTIILFILLGYPLLVSLWVPLFGLYHLIKDVVHFYFTIYTPGFPAGLLNPTFALSGVMFSWDESERAKQEAMENQYGAAQMGFMIPFSQEKQELYFDTIMEQSKGEIVPETRRIETLVGLNVLPEDYDVEQVNRFNAAFGIARSLDRTLAQEVAVTEMSLARHVLYLRRLVLRYVKTLLMFLWTTIVTLIMLPLLRDERFPALVIIAIGYLVWALAVRRVIRLPLYWIYRHRKDHLGEVPDQIDPQLQSMQNAVEPWCKWALYSAGVGLILAIWATIAGGL